jgi:uncharacterized protein with HEPN domain
MFKGSHKDAACLLNILDSVEKIRKYAGAYKNADELYADSKSFDAVMMNFIVIGEMAEKLTEEFKFATNALIDWLKIRGFRNIIAHNYFGIDAEEVWQIIENSLSDLEINIKVIVKE